MNDVPPDRPKGAAPAPVEDFATAVNRIAAQVNTPPFSHKAAIADVHAAYVQQTGNQISLADFKQEVLKNAQGDNRRIQLLPLDDPKAMSPELREASRIQSSTNKHQSFEFIDRRSAPTPLKPMGFGASTPKTPDQGGQKVLPPPEQGRVRLFNAGTLDRDPGKYLEPHVSDWVNEIAAGAGDFDDLSEITKPLIYLSDEPEKWLPMIVGRKIGKHPTEVTLDDIRQHGRLNVVDADPEYDTIYKVGDFSSDEKVTRLDGERVKWWETDLYDSEDFRDMPVGPEPNDFISRDAAEISQSLTGNDLVEFMQANGFKDPAAKPPIKGMGAAAPFAAVSGAGLTSERELGSKMKREKKD
jgi:hypothetical protein